MCRRSSARLSRHRSVRTMPSGHPVAWQGPGPRYLGRHPFGFGTVPWREVVAMKDKPRFKVAVRQDPEDHSAWLANVVGAPGAQTFGRSLAEAKRHSIEVVALGLGQRTTEGLGTRGA